jgi:hypothetical protein
MLSVCVIGLLPRQANEVERRLKNITQLKLNFLINNTQMNKKRIPQKTDYVLMSRHAKHLYSTAGKSIVSSDRLLYIGTSVTRIADKIRELANGQPELAKAS